MILFFSILIQIASRLRLKHLTFNLEARKARRVLEAEIYHSRTP